jgi:hypothetical protein
MGAYRDFAKEMMMLADRAEDPQTRSLHMDTALMLALADLVERGPHVIRDETDRALDPLSVFINDVRGESVTA